MATYLIFNAASAIQYGDVLKGDFRIKAVIPTIPAAGHARKFGLFSAHSGSGLYFEVTGTTFQAVIKDGNANQTATAPITFETVWAGEPLEFKIRWEANLVHFYIDGTRKATLSMTSAIDLASTPLSIYISNSNADVMLVGNIEAQGLQAYTTNT